MKMCQINHKGSFDSTESAAAMEIVLHQWKGGNCNVSLTFLAIILILLVKSEILLKRMERQMHYVKRVTIFLIWLLGPLTFGYSSSHLVSYMELMQ